MRGRTRRNCLPGLTRPWRGRSATRPSGPVTGSVGRLPETLALAAILHLPATPPHSPQPEYALASLCTKWSSLSFALFWSCRCWPFVVILKEISLVVLHIPVFLLFCKKSVRSCLSPRNPPCYAFFCFCSVLGMGRPQPYRQIAQDSSTPPGPPVGVVAWGLSPRRHDPDGSASALRPIVGCHA